MSYDIELAARPVRPIRREEFEFLLESGASSTSGSS